MSFAELQVLDRYSTLHIDVNSVFHKCMYKQTEIDYHIDGYTQGRTHLKGCGSTDTTKIL